VNDKADGAAIRQRRMADALRRNLILRRTQKRLRSAQEAAAPVAESAAVNEAGASADAAVERPKRCRNDNA
jgi:hypothetical protein